MRSKQIISTLVTCFLLCQVSFGYPQASTSTDGEVKEYKVTIKAKIPKTSLEAFSLSGKECQNVQFDIPVTSINTYDTCAQLYVNENCQGENFRQEATAGEEEFKKQVASVGPCLLVPKEKSSERSDSWEIRNFVPPAFQNLVPPEILKSNIWGGSQHAATQPSPTEMPQMETSDWGSLEQASNKIFPRFKHWHLNYDSHPSDDWDLIEPSETEKPYYEKYTRFYRPFDFIL